MVRKSPPKMASKHVTAVLTNAEIDKGLAKRNPCYMKLNSTEKQQYRGYARSVHNATEFGLLAAVKAALQGTVLHASVIKKARCMSGK